MKYFKLLVLITLLVLVSACDQPNALSATYDIVEPELILSGEPSDGVVGEEYFFVLDSEGPVDIVSVERVDQEEELEWLEVNIESNVNSVSFEGVPTEVGTFDWIIHLELSNGRNFRQGGSITVE